MAHSDLESRLLRLQGQLDTTQRELETQRSLNTKIEEDLLRINTASTTYAPSIAASTRYTFRPTPPRVGGGATTTSPTSSIIGSRDDTLLPAKANSSDTTILPIITQQRDRFRARNAELEQDLRKQLTLISSLRGEIQALKTDNLELYEKVRFLQHFTKNVGGGAGAGNGDVNALLEEGGIGASGSERPGASVGMERYRAAYEESMTPFEAFRSKVRMPSFPI